MDISATSLPGVHLIQGETFVDDRGSFARLWDLAQFGDRQLHLDPSDLSLSRNIATGTLRGMHLQRNPHEEIKLVQCVRGALFDVAIDLRPESPTYGAWHGEILSTDNRRALLIPGGLAHGFLTLEPATDVLYLMCGRYSPEHACGVRWNDPAFGIAWPAVPRVLSDRDATYPDFDIRDPWRAT